MLKLQSWRKHRHFLGIFLREKRVAQTLECLQTDRLPQRYITEGRHMRKMCQVCTFGQVWIWWRGWESTVCRRYTRLEYCNHSVNTLDHSAGSRFVAALLQGEAQQLCTHRAFPVRLTLCPCHESSAWSKPHDFFLFTGEGAQFRRRQAYSLTHTHTPVTSLSLNIINLQLILPYLFSFSAPSIIYLSYHCTSLL